MKYLATPYSHPDPAVREARFRIACRVAAILMLNGEQIFSPIAHTHPVVNSTTGNVPWMPSDFNFWEKYDRWFIERCDELIVVFMDGTTESKGVAGEIEMAREFKLPIRYVDVEGNTRSIEKKRV